MSVCFFIFLFRFFSDQPFFHFRGTPTVFCLFFFEKRLKNGSARPKKNYKDDLDKLNEIALGIAAKYTIAKMEQVEEI